MCVFVVFFRSPAGLESCQLSELEPTWSQPRSESRSELGVALKAWSPHLKPGASSLQPERARSNWSELAPSWSKAGGSGARGAKTSLVWWALVWWRRPRAVRPERTCSARPSPAVFVFALALAARAVFVFVFVFALAARAVFVFVFAFALAARAATAVFVFVFVIKFRRTEGRCVKRAATLVVRHREDLAPEPNKAAILEGLESRLRSVTPSVELTLLPFIWR